ISGTVDQAYEDYSNFLDNYEFFTSVPLESKSLHNLGINLSKHVRKNQKNFLLFCKKIWFDAENNGKAVISPIISSLEILDPEGIIPEIVEMCRSSKDIQDVDLLVSGFETVFLRKPEEYFDLLNKYISDQNIWVKRLIIVTAGKIMYRHKTNEITNRCLDILRTEIDNENKAIRKATSWTIGSYGVRADQKAIASFILSFADCNNPVVVSNFSEAFRRSKISLQMDVSNLLIPQFEEWSNSSNTDISRSANSALRLLKR
ncbi:DNA alkylation repair protein, partial [candidate division KSB1 bacterium]